MLANKNENAKINSIDCESIIGAFILKNIQNILTIKNEKVYEEPRGSLVIRVDNDKNMICIPTGVLETYLKTEAKVSNINAFKKQLKTNNIDYEIKKTRMTSHWDKMAATPEWNLYCYCFKNLKISELTKATNE